MAMVSAHAQLNNQAAVAASLGRIRSRVEARFEAGMRAAGDEIYRISQILVPVLTGDLKRSGMNLPTGNGFNTQVNVWYDTYYAGFVHEQLGNYHEPPTQAKYLEDAYRQVRPQIARLLATGDMFMFTVISDNFDTSTITEIV